MVLARLGVFNGAICFSIRITHGNLKACRLNLAEIGWVSYGISPVLLVGGSYPIILITFGFVFVQALQKKLQWKVAVPFGINLIAHLIFRPIQFGLRNLPLAAVDIVIVWITIIWMMVTIWKHYEWVAVAQVPYFVWVSIASVLQLAITFSNW